MLKTISRDTPLSELTLRRYEKPYTKDKRELDIIVDILLVLLKSRNKKILMTSEEIKNETVNTRKKYKLPLRGVASSNVRRQLKRLRDVYLVEKIKNDYRITEFEPLSVIFDKRIKDLYLKNILERVKEYYDNIT